MFWYHNCFGINEKVILPKSYAIILNSKNPFIVDSTAKLRPNTPVALDKVNAVLITSCKLSSAALIPSTWNTYRISSSKSGSVAYHE